jgi:hypothetical protein
MPLLFNLHYSLQQIVFIKNFLDDEEIEAHHPISPATFSLFLFKHFSLIVKMGLLGLKVGSLGFEPCPKWRYLPQSEI